MLYTFIAILSHRVGRYFMGIMSLHFNDALQNHYFEVHDNTLIQACMCMAIASKGVYQCMAIMVSFLQRMFMCACIISIYDTAGIRMQQY